MVDLSCRRQHFARRFSLINQIRIHCFGRKKLYQFVFYKLSHGRSGIYLRLFLESPCKITLNECCFVLLLECWSLVIITTTMKTTFRLSFIYVCQKLLNKESTGWWIEISWRSFDVTVIAELFLVIAVCIPESLTGFRTSDTHGSNKPNHVLIYKTFR